MASIKATVPVRTAFNTSSSRVVADLFLVAHAKGLLLDGEFKPAPEAKHLSVAPHYNTPSTPLIARFSVGGGIPNVSDTDGRAQPKGVAIRFKIDKDTHTDLIAHSFNGFATSTGEEFEQLLKLLIAKAQKLPNAEANLMKFASTRPKTVEFLTAPKPNPHNYGTITYYQPNTHILTNKEGRATPVRYQLRPRDGQQLYDDKDLAGLPASYLHEDLLSRFPAKPIVLDLFAHIADPTDDLNDACKLYASTTFVPMGTITFNGVTKDNAAEQQQIAFSPTPEKGGPVPGIKSSGDPLIQARKGVYWISADQRRHEKRTEDVGFKMP